MSILDETFPVSELRQVTTTSSLLKVLSSVLMNLGALVNFCAVRKMVDLLFWLMAQPMSCFISGSRKVCQFFVTRVIFVRPFPASQRTKPAVCKTEEPKVECVDRTFNYWCRDGSANAEGSQKSIFSLKSRLAHLNSTHRTTPTSHNLVK